MYEHLDPILVGAYAAYEKGGQSAVAAFAAEQGITTRAYCAPCESNEPLYRGCCLTCGTINRTHGKEKV